MNEQELLDLKEEIVEVKETNAQLQGQQTELLSQLKTTFGCKTIEEAKLLMEEKATKRNVLDKEIKEKSDVIEAKYFTDEN